MGRYTSDDNRSMQLNDNNDRYYSSRGIDRDDLGYDFEETNNTTQEANMLIEVGNTIINTGNITTINSELHDLEFVYIKEKTIIDTANQKNTFTKL